MGPASTSPTAQPKPRSRSTARDQVTRTEIVRPRARRGVLDRPDRLTRRHHRTRQSLRRRHLRPGLTNALTIRKLAENVPAPLTVHPIPGLSVEDLAELAGHPGHCRTGPPFMPPPPRPARFGLAAGCRMRCHARTGRTGRSAKDRRPAQTARCEPRDRVILCTSVRAKPGGKRNVVTLCRRRNYGLRGRRRLRIRADILGCFSGRHAFRYRCRTRA